MDVSKDKKKQLLEGLKQESLDKDASVISKNAPFVYTMTRTNCDLGKDGVYLEFCETKEQKDLWKTFVHLTSSLPFRGAVGRQVKLFVRTEDHILGMVHLTSPLAQMRVRDDYLGFEDKWKQLRGFYNIGVCVPTRKYAQALTGKLLVYCIFSNPVYQYLEEKYGDRVIGFETTSLYGKSSMYNRIPFLKYLGLTDGLSAVYICDSEWAAVKREYAEVFPSTKTNRLAPVKFQIVDKLANYYKSKGVSFPYKYSSQSFRRGVYFGYRGDTELSDAVQSWRERWYYKRMGYLKSKK